MESMNIDQELCRFLNELDRPIKLEQDFGMYFRLMNSNYLPMPHEQAGFGNWEKQISQTGDFIIMDSAPNIVPKVEPDLIIKKSPPSSPPTTRRRDRPCHSRGDSDLTDICFSDDECVSPQETPGHSRNSSADEILDYIDWNPSHLEKPSLKSKRETNTTKESQQEKHKTAEKKRRNDMNEIIEKLKQLLPPSGRETKMTKISVLQETSDYVTKVQELCLKLIRENKSITSDNERLLMELNHLREVVNQRNSNQDSQKMDVSNPQGAQFFQNKRTKM